MWGRTFQGEVGGLWLTVLMSFTAGVLSLVIGISAALAAWLGPRPLRKVLQWLADFVRAIPLIFVIFWIYFLVPALFGVEIPGPASVVAALAWFSSGAVMYTTLSGLEALPRGHREAGLASGLTERQIFASILLPQALRNLVPSYVALFASMIKDTSLAYIMNVPELTMTANQVNTRTQIYPAAIFLFTAAVYFVICAALSWGARGLASILKPGVLHKNASKS
jgi:polar amino acid transport system permease protein